jgi:SAM-dependent methyltransferase
MRPARSAPDGADNQAVADESSYLLDNRQVQAGERFAALSELFDPVTRRHVDALGIAPGWRCWEVGAGGASIPAWLADRVGPSGYVLASDIDLSWMPPDPPFATRLHDVGTTPPPEAEFDLIHTRLVLVHVPRREQALTSLVSALRPGGWLLLEEADPALQPLVCPDEHDEAARLANRLKLGFRQLMLERGVDLAYGRTLPRRLRAAGLVNVAADASFPVTGPACTVLERATTEQIRDQLIAAGLATEEEIRVHLANLDEREMDLASSPLISCWGRRPVP